MNTIVNERKLDFIDIVSEGLRISFFKIKDISLLALVSFIPTGLMMVAVAEAFPSEDTPIDVVKILLVLFLLLVQAIISLIASMSVAVITEKVVDNEPISIIEAVKYATSKWGSAFMTSLLVSVIVFGLSLLFVIPGIIYGTYYIFVLYVVVLRNKSGREALSYSKTLVEGQWWRVFGILLGIGIIFAIFNGIITYPLSKVSDNPYFAIVPNAVSLLLSTIFGVMNVVLFLNNDFVYHRRLARRKEVERTREIKKAPTIEEYPSKTRKDKNAPVKPSPSKKVVRKAENKATKKISTVKSSAVKKGIKTAPRKNTS